MPGVRYLRSLGIAGVLISLMAPADAQTPTRRVATLDLLTEHALFFHGQDVILRADAVGETVLTYLVSDDARLLALDVPPPLNGTTERLEVVGTFYDVGRLEPTDPRTTGLPFERLADSLLDKPWPGVGELLVIVAASSRPVTADGTITLRSVALDPEAHLDQSVTVTGRFRGRNLYGDLPDSPGESTHDFVLSSANAAVWVVGLEPKGDDFDLDVRARLDTGRWLEVTGQARVHEGMAIIDAGTIRLVEARADTATLPRRAERRQGPPPEVIFSTPFEGDTDVPTDGLVRIQFSRDMNPGSFTDRVRLSYAPSAGVGATSDALVFHAEYRGRNRVMEIRLEQPLRPFREVTIQLLGGITASDGAELPPWSLSFFAGP